jgi:hypothetical protein
MNSEKQRRMALRRDIGNRAPPAPVRRELGACYRIAHACFGCRKSFKVEPRQARIAVCPVCAGQLWEMGRSFKAPQMRDLDQWAKIEALHKAGFRFFSYRSVDGPPLPERLAQVEQFIHENPNHPLRVAPARG